VYLTGCLYLVLLFAVFFRLGDFPALHGDEAYAGLGALDILHHGVTTPHFVHYSAPIIPGLMAVAFHLNGLSLFSLRILTPVLNAFAVLLMVVFLRRRFGVLSTATYLLLLLSSLLFLIKARIGWDVTAVNPLVLALMVTSLYFVAEGGQRSSIGALSFLYASHLGVVSHFYFLTVPPTLLVAAFLSLWICRDRRWAGVVIFLALNLGLSALVYELKPRLSPEAWMRHRPLWSLVFLLAPLPFFLCWTWLGPRIVTASERLLSYLWRPRPSRMVTSLLAFGLVYGLANSRTHLKAFAEVLSNTPLIHRVYSIPPTLGQTFVGYLWAVALIASLGLATRHAMKQRDPWLVFCALAPICLLAILRIFTGINSIRYYLIPFFLSMAFLSMAASRLRAKQARITIPLLIAAAVYFNALNFSEMFQSEDRKPYYFRIGAMREVSWSYMKLDPLVERLRVSGQCPSPGSDEFMARSVRFFREMNPWPCTASVTVAYCLDCVRPPYWVVRD